MALRFSPPAVVALAAVVLGLAFHLRTIALPTETLTSRYLADDYFYYLNVAHHIAEGRGSSFDGGLTRTNGYQPLFLGLLVAVFGAGASKLAAIHLGLLIQAVAMAAAAWAAYALLAARLLPWSGALAAGLLSLNLFFVLPTLTGFEMALALAGLLWAVWCWQTEQPAIITGVVCGLAALARVDMAVVPATIAVWLLARRRTRDAMLLAAASGAVVAPWTIWSTLQFGSPFPDSGFIKAHYQGIAATWHSVGTAFVALPRVLMPPRIADWASAAGFAWMLSLAAGAIVLAALWQLRRTENRWLALIAALIAGAYLTMIDPFESGAVVRYLFPVWAIIVLLVVQSASLRLPWVVVLLLTMHAVDIAIYLRWERTAALPLSYVGTAHTIAPRVIQRLSPEGVVASFDSGALGYFAPRPVVNLDGLANHDIVLLRQSCAKAYDECLREYLAARNVRVLIGGTGFGWTSLVRDWARWERLYASPPLADGSTLVVLRVP